MIRDDEGQALPLFSVIPAQAGIQNLGRRGSSETLRVWIPAFAGMTREITAPPRSSR
ncbi:conserved hypothetical protein [Sphingomonas sp. 8AM]|nr:conserved hypothetical protein [Sphingomonas sp. 8AM]